MKVENSENSQPLVYVVIPNKNGAVHLRYALESLFKTTYTNFRAVLVDNRSTDDSLLYVAANFPQVEVVLNDTDVGFAGSVNKGVLHALSRGANYIAVFSNDIKVKPDWIDFTLRAFAAHPAAGVAGYIEVPKEKENIFFDSAPSGGIEKEVKALPGCLLLFSAEIFLKAGLLDEGYFMYGEDTDFFVRVTRAGFRLLQTGMPVWHYGEGSAAKKRLFPVWMTYRNALRFSLKNSGFFGAVRMAAALFYHGCLPHFDADISDPSLKRQRRYSAPVNLLLLAGSAGWNLWHLPATLKARRCTGAERTTAAAGGGKRRLRIAILNITGGGISGGYVRYLENMLPRLSASEEVESILCVSPKLSSVSYKMAGFKNIKFCDCRPALPFKHFPEAQLEARLDDFRPDVIFVPTARHIRYRRVPVVTMIQNMAPMKPHGDYPLLESLKMLGQRIEAKYAVSRAAHIIAMSCFVRDFLLSEWHIPAARISLVYFGSPPVPATLLRPASVPEGLSGKCFFSAGSLEPYRGTEDILYAVSELKKRGKNVKALIAGVARKTVAAYERKLRAIAADEGIEENVLWLGALSKEEMDWCYSRCTAFIMTSRVEALAVVTLEALSHGCLCISVDNPPLPEAFGEAALYYPTGDGRLLADKIAGVLGLTTEERTSMAATARLQAAKFSWDTTAVKTIKVFRAVVSGNLPV